MRPATRATVCVRIVSESVVKHFAFQFYGFGSCGQTMLFIVFEHMHATPLRYICPVACARLVRHFRMFVRVYTFCVRHALIWKWNSILGPSTRIFSWINTAAKCLPFSFHAPSRWINVPKTTRFFFFDRHILLGRHLQRSFMHIRNRKRFLHQFRHFHFPHRCHTIPCTRTHTPNIQKLNQTVLFDTLSVEFITSMLTTISEI